MSGLLKVVIDIIIIVILARIGYITFQHFNKTEIVADKMGGVGKLVIDGKEIFEDNCVICHGVAAVGLSKDWKESDENGNFPAPPLNGSAHAWHHSPVSLMRTINEGGVKLGGRMPGFKDRLSQDEKEAVLVYIHDLWPADVQTKYDGRFMGEGSKKAVIK